MRTVGLRRYGGISVSEARESGSMNLETHRGYSTVRV